MMHPSSVHHASEKTGSYFCTSCNASALTISYRLSCMARPLQHQRQEWQKTTDCYTMQCHGDHSSRATTLNYSGRIHCVGKDNKLLQARKGSATASPVRLGRPQRNILDMTQRQCVTDVQNDVKLTLIWFCSTKGHENYTHMTANQKTHLRSVLHELYYWMAYETTCIGVGSAWNRSQTPARGLQWSKILHWWNTTWQNPHKSALTIIYRRRTTKYTPTYAAAGYHWRF